MNAYIGESIDKCAEQSRLREMTLNQENENMASNYVVRINQRVLDTRYIPLLQAELSKAHGCDAPLTIKLVRAFTMEARRYVGYPTAAFQRECDDLLVLYRPVQ